MADSVKGSRENPYSMSEYEQMLDNGTWKGGYVKDDAGDVTYAMGEVICEGYSGSGSGSDHGSDFEFSDGSYNWHDPDSGSDDDGKGSTGNGGGNGNDGGTGTGTGGNTGPNRRICPCYMRQWIPHPMHL